MSGVQIPVEAKLSAGDIERVVDQLKEQINKLGASIAGANKIKFNPIDRATIEDLKRVQAQFESLTRISGDFRKRMKDTGQGGAGFFDIDWARMYVDPSIRARQMHKAFNYVAAGTGASISTSAPTPARGGSGGAIGGGGGQSPGTSWRAQGRNIIGSGLKAAGPVGGVANSALSAGMSGGVVAGLAGLTGGLLALGVGKAISAVAAKIGDAQTENIGADTLKRQLGDVNASFGVLKDSLRAASSDIGVTFNEGQKLGAEFAHIAGLTAKQSDQLADEVRIGGELGRSFGVDPSQSVRFLATERQFGVTQNVTDSAKLAATFAEAIAKSGAFAKVDEVMSAVSNFTAQQTRLGLTPANATGYMSALAGLVGSHTPGLDVGGAASMLDRANGALTSAPNGGNAPFQNFLYMALGRRNGLDPIQTQMLEEQGLFGSPASTFGKGSNAERYGIHVGGLSTKTNLELIMDQMRRIYGDKPAGHELMASAISKNFGLSIDQAMSFATMQPADLGGVTRRMSRLGINLSKINGTGLSAMAQIEGNRGLSESQKDAQERTAAANGQEKTTGTEVRDSVVGLQNVLQTFADRAVPLLNDSRDALIMMAGGGKKGAAGIHEAVLNAQRNDVNAQADARIAKARSQYQLTSINGGMGSQTAGDMKAAADAYDNLQTETKAANEDRAAGLAQVSASDLNISPTLARKAGDRAVNAALADQQKYGVPASVTLAQYALESGYGTSGIAKLANNPFGIHAAAGQDFVMGTDVDPKTGKRVPTPFRKFKSIDEAFDEHAKLLAKNPAYAEARKHTNDPMAYADALTGHYATDPMYGTKLKSLMKDGMYAMPLPNGATSATPQQVNVNVSGAFTLNHPNGQPAAAPVNVSTRVGAPQASGRQ